MVTILFSLRLYWCRVPCPYDLFLLAAPRVPPVPPFLCLPVLAQNNNLSKYELEKTSDKVEFSAYSDDYTNSMIFGRTKGKNYYCKSRFDGTWDTVNLATKDDLNTYAQKEITPAYGRWDAGIQNAYFKMKKHSGDNFLPFLKMSTDDGAWVIGVHSSLNRLVFRYYANETGAGVSVYEFDPNASPKIV